MIHKLKRIFQRYKDDSPIKRRQRILALDLLRGLFMICIIINHNAGWSPSLVNIFTGQGTLFASAAEGFFAISGILVGYIYGPKILKSKKDVLLKLWKRAGLLYILTVGFTLIFAAWSILTPAVDYRIAPWTGNMVDFLLQTFTLQFAYGWHDFLRQYAVYMFLAPLALFLCAIGRWWIVLIISTIVMLTIGDLGILHPYSSWQIIFMFSLVIGYYLPSIEKRWESLTTKVRKVAAWTIVAVALASYLISVYLFTLLPAIVQILPSIFSTDQLSSLQAIIHFRDVYILPHFIPRDYMSILRLLFGLLWFTALYILFRKYEFTIDTRTKGVLSFFGKNSLIIFCLHAVLLFIQSALIGSQPIVNIYLNTIIHLNLLVWVYILVYLWQSKRHTPKPDFDVK